MDPQAEHITTRRVDPVVVEERVVEHRPIAHVERTDVERIETGRRIAPHSIAAGLLAIGMLLWGGVAMARAGFGDDLRDPGVEVFGIAGNAISGMIVAGIGVLLLLAAASYDRGPAVVISILTGIAALIVAIEPSAGDDALGTGSTLPALIAVGCAVVVVVALAFPIVDQRSRRIAVDDR